MVLRSIKQKVLARRLQSENVPELFRRAFAQVKNLDTRMAVRDGGFVVFDTEATGLKPDKGDVLLAIAGVGLRNGRVDLSMSFYELIRPERDIPRQSVVIHNLTPQRLKDLPPASEVLGRFFEFCQGDTLVGHNVSLDMRFLNRTLQESFGITLVNRVLDTGLIAMGIQKMKDPTKTAMEGVQNQGLDALAREFNIEMPDRHDAYGDAFATALIFQRQLGILHRAGIKTLKGLLKIGEVR
jgi:DNA polymerase-3 subunit epsilon